MMKLLGFLFLPAGWAIALAALVMFGQQPPRGVFVVAGMCVQGIGLALIFHRIRRRKELSR